MASSKTKSKGRTKKRAQRATSNVFAMFDQTQIQEFKEAFNMIDENKDGFIDKEDLHDILASLGKIITNLRGGGLLFVHPLIPGGPLGTYQIHNCGCCGGLHSLFCTSG